MNAKRIISAFLAVLMLLGTLSVGIAVSAAEKTTYSDVNDGMWSYKDIMYVSEHGLMNGTGGSTFSPAVDVTRAMVVTVLYRMEDSPRVTFDPYAYADVPEGEFYSDAVMWAKNNGIVTSVGTNENYEDLFAPTRAITRQELATMFVRYAEYRFVITEKQADLSGFKDIGDVADWASKAMSWCNEAGLINGTGNGDTLSPKMTATREQFAAIIHRFDVAEFEYRYLLNEPKPTSKFTEPEYSLVNDADLYVAVDGDDKNPGTLDKPLATFEAAVAKVRELKKTAKDEIVVAFKAGDYGNLQLELTEEDAGTEKTPITYRRYGDGDVVFRNGVTVSIDEFKPIDESDHYLFPEKNRGKIMKADVSGKDTIGSLTAMSPLFSEEERISMARFPNKSAATGKDQFITFVDSYETIKPGISSFNGIDPNTEYGDYGTWACKLTSMGARTFDSYHTYENIIAVGKAGAEYDGDYITIDSYDRDTDTLVFTTHDWIDSFNSFGGAKLYYMNISEELDAQGEYWFNAETKTLYVYNPNCKKYTLGTAGTFLKLDGADHTSFVGFQFRSSADDAIQVDSNNVTIDNCLIFGTNGRTPAVIIKGYNNKLINSELSNLSAGGIIIGGGDFEMLTPSNSVVDNNLLHNFGQIYHSWPYVTGIYIEGGVGVTVSHNEICDSPHMAIMFASLWGRSIDCVIEYNYIHDVINLCYGDLGAIYCGRLHTDRDNIVRYNIVANISGSAWGVYVDDGMSGQQFYSNIFYAPGGYAFLHSGGRDNVIEDNIIVSGPSGYGQPLRIWAKWAEMLKNDGAVNSGNWHHMRSFIAPYLPKTNEAQKLWRERWPELFATWEGPECTLENFDDYNMMANSAGCVFKNNYSFGYSSEHWILDPHDNKFNEFKNNPIWDDDALKGEGDAPHIFVNPALGDYSLRNDCTLEFEYKYDFSKIGRY